MNLEYATKSNTYLPEITLRRFLELLAVSPEELLPEEGLPEREELSGGDNCTELGSRGLP